MSTMKLKVVAVVSSLLCGASGFMAVRLVSYKPEMATFVIVMTVVLVGGLTTITMLEK